MDKIIEQQALKHVKATERLVREINPLLQGKGPEVQGAALCDLVAMYFAGHHPAIREQCLEQWLKTMRELIPVNESAIFRHYGRPEGWEPN